MREARRPKPISDATKRWAASHAGDEAKVIAARRLIGGTASVVHSLTIEVAGRRHRWVLRQWSEGMTEESRTAVLGEASILRKLEGSGLPVPELVAADADGINCSGTPSLLMTKLTGQVHLDPRDPDTWLRRMAALLPRIHSLEVDAPAYDDWLERPLSPPEWSDHPDVWRAAIALLDAKSAPFIPTFIHRDFQHFNILWSREQVSGIVDWTFASTGPPEADVGHCRLNLAVLFAPDWAERFLHAYESESGRKADPYWDVIALLTYLPGWGSSIQVQAGRKKRLDQAGMHGRADQLMLSAMNRP